MKNAYKDIREICGSIIDKNLSTENFLTSKAFRDYRAGIRSYGDLRFYKYCKPDYYDIRNFETDTIMLKHPDKFNDMFEGMVISGELDNGKTKSIIKRACNSVVVSCFSEQWNNLLMYAHYADSFKGFCLEYDVSNVYHDYFYECFYPVLYQSKPSTRFKMEALEKTILAIESHFDKGHSIILSKEVFDLISYFIHKANIWEYEKEWRLIVPIDKFPSIFGTTNYHNEYYFINNFDYVTGVYLAPNIQDHIRRHLCDIVNTKNIQRARNSKPRIKIYQVSIKEKQYRLSRKLIKQH